MSAGRGSFGWRAALALLGVALAVAVGRRSGAEAADTPAQPVIASQSAAGNAMVELHFHVDVARTYVVRFTSPAGVAPFSGNATELYCQPLCGWVGLPFGGLTPKENVVAAPAVGVTEWEVMLTAQSTSGSGLTVEVRDATPASGAPPPTIVAVGAPLGFVPAPVTTPPAPTATPAPGSAAAPTPTAVPLPLGPYPLGAVAICRDGSYSFAPRDQPQCATAFGVIATL